MPRCAVVFFSCLLSASISLAQSAKLPTHEELKEIANKPHQAKLVMPELKIYPSIPKAHLVTTIQFHNRDPKVVELDADEKWVDGRYIVTSYILPGTDEHLSIIVTYDRDSNCYRKWIISSQSIRGAMVGTRIGESRTLSWVSIPTEDDDNHIAVSQETHADNSTEWSELHVIDGRVIGRIIGKAHERN